MFSTSRFCLSSSQSSLFFIRPSPLLLVHGGVIIRSWNRQCGSGFFSHQNTSSVSLLTSVSSSSILPIATTNQFKRNSVLSSSKPKKLTKKRSRSTSSKKMPPKKQGTIRNREDEEATQPGSDQPSAAAATQSKEQLAQLEADFSKLCDEVAYEDNVAVVDKFLISSPVSRAKQLLEVNNGLNSSLLMILLKREYNAQSKPMFDKIFEAINRVGGESYLRDQLLAEKNPDRNPLMIACISRNLSTVQLVIGKIREVDKSGKDELLRRQFERTDDWGLSLLQIVCVDNTDLPILTLMFKTMKGVDNTKEFMKKQLESLRDGEGWTPLMTALWFSMPIDCINFLVDEIVNIGGDAYLKHHLSWRDSNQRTPLTIVASSNKMSEDVLKLLIDLCQRAGGDKFVLESLLAKDDEGATTIVLAVRNRDMMPGALRIIVETTRRIGGEELLNQYLDTRSKNKKSLLRETIDEFKPKTPVCKYIVELLIAQKLFDSQCDCLTMMQWKALQKQGFPMNSPEPASTSKKKTK